MVGREGLRCCWLPAQPRLSIEVVEQSDAISFFTAVHVGMGGRRETVPSRYLSGTRPRNQDSSDRRTIKQHKRTMCCSF